MGDLSRFLKKNKKTKRKLYMKVNMMKKQEI